MRGFLRWAPWILLLLAVWLGVGEGLYRGAGWNYEVSNLMAIAAASVLFNVLNRLGWLPTTRDGARSR